MKRNYLIILFLLVLLPLQIFSNQWYNSLNDEIGDIINEKGREVVFFEHFDHGGEPPPGWEQEIITGSESWLFKPGNGEGHPPAAYSGSTNACLYDYWGSSGAGHVCRLISPIIDFGSFTSQPNLTFWIYQEQWGSYQDYTSVEYRASADETWQQIGFITNNFSWWHKVDDLPYLPNPSSNYQISFVGELNGGYGICLDDIQITGENTGIVDEPPLPNQTELLGNYPNPFNPVTMISFNIMEKETGILSIYNLKGQVLLLRKFDAGKHEYEWSSEGKASGFYFYKLETNSYRKIQKMLLLK